MSRKYPTAQDRIQQSFTSREFLITRLEQVLAEGRRRGEPPERLVRMEVRIAELKRRNQDPAQNLYLGSKQRRLWLGGEAPGFFRTLAW